MKIIPTIIMIEMFLACIPYLLCREWGNALYWFAGGILNLAVIYLIPRGI